MPQTPPRQSPVEGLVAEVATHKETEARLHREIEELRRSEDRARTLARRALRLQEATAALSGALTSDEVCATLLAHLRETFAVSDGVVHLRDERGRLRPHADRDLPTDLQRLLGDVDADGPLAKVIRCREPIWLEDAAAIESHCLAVGTKAATVRALVALPLAAGSDVLGVVALAFDRPHPFDGDERAWLERFAAEGARAAARARRHLEERDARAEAETLLRVVDSLGSAQLDEEAIVQRVIDEATALLGATLGVFFYETTDTDGELQARQALAGPRRDDFAALGLTREAVLAPAPGRDGALRIDDVHEDPRWAARLPASAATAPMTSLLAVPVISPEGTTLGGLVLIHPQPGRFSAQHERIVKGLAASAASAIENARLYRGTREAHQRYRRLVDELAETVRLNDLFTGVLAHDLRNPLTGIIMSVRLASARAKDEQLARPLGRIATSAERMMRLVEQLLDFTRVRLGQNMPLHPRASDLLPLVRHAIEELEEAHASARVQVERRGDSAGVWDADRLGQVFSNLIGNALQHGDGEEVRIVIDGEAPDEITFCIHNQGCIPPALLPHLFEPFGRADRTHHHSRGLGLGLFIAQQIARSHGGRLDVRSDDQEGTTFTLVLPRQTKETQAEARPAPAAVLREARERVWQTEQRLRLLIDGIRDYGIFMLDTEGRVVSWNIGAQRLKGYTAGEIIGQHFSVFYTPADREAGRPQRLLAEAASQGRVEDLGWRVRKDGTRFWADVIISALKDSNGELRGYAKVTRDLSQRREDEERLRRSEEQFRLIVESVRDYAIFKLDPQGIVATWNVGAQRIKGYRADEIIGQHFSRFYEAHEIRAGKCEMELEVAAREGQFIDEGWRLRKDGTRFWAHVTITALRSANGTLLGFAKVTRDLSERRKLEDERVRAARAEEAIRLRDEFLSMASHELKTPLTGLKLQLESLERRLDVSDDKVAANLRRASESSDRLTALVESLLDVTRINAGSFELTPEAFDLTEVVEAVTTGFQQRAARAGCELRLHTAGPIAGRWDRLRMEHLLASLIHNALTYGAGAPVDVSISGDDNEAVLEVRDRGPGIPEEKLEGVFSRFIRHASPRHYGGLGLGLYLVREIARAHGGDVSVGNAPDGGAHFVVRLPTTPRAPLRADAAARVLQ